MTRRSRIRRCSRTGKRVFRDELEAKIFLSNISLMNSRDRKRQNRDEPTRTFRCGACHLWHVAHDTAKVDAEPVT